MTDKALPSDARLTAVVLDYLVPLTIVDAALPEHIAWLDTAYDAGLLVMSGRREPRCGGVLLMRGDEQAARALSASDPFIQRGIAKASFYPFTASLADAKLASLL